MATLHTMFNVLSTRRVTTNKPAIQQWPMAEMHPTMRRLYEATRSNGRELKQADLARRLNTSSQRIKNWEIRGISQQGANEAQTEFGVSSTWLLDGEGPSHIELALSQPERLDAERLADLIEVVENAAIKANRLLSPKAKARIVVSLYQSEQVPAAVEARSPVFLQRWSLPVLNLLLRDQIAEILSEEAPPPPRPDDVVEADISPMAMQKRAILRIAEAYPWGISAVRHFLDLRTAACLSDLTMPQMDDLLERMQAYKDAADNGFSSPDEPVAN